MKVWIVEVLVLAIVISSIGLNANLTTTHASEATEQDIAFEQAHYGTLVTSGLIENPVLGSKYTPASSSWGYAAGTYSTYSKSIQADFSIPMPNDVGASEYYIVIEPTTSVAGFGGNGVTSYNRRVSLRSDTGTTYTQVWGAPGNGQAIGAGNYSVYTDYMVVKLNGPIDYTERDAKGSGVGLAEYNASRITNMRLYWSWGSSYYETMKSLKYRIYRKELPPTTAPVITVTPNQEYHTGANNTFSIAKPTYYANYQEQQYGILQYRLNGGNWTNYTLNDSISIPNEGETKIESRLLTRDTLESQYGVAYSRQDNTRPDIPMINGLDSTKWYRGSYDLSFTAGSDAHSGVSGVYYTLSGATEQAKSKIDSSSGAIKKITAEGQTVVTATTVDKVGLESDPISAKVNIDNTPPVGVLTAPQGWRSSLFIHVEGTDSASGMKSILLPSGVIWNGSTYDYPVTQNGEYHFIFSDVVGNTTLYFLM